MKILIPSNFRVCAKTKLKGEKIIINNKNNRLNYVIIRPSQVVGENMNAVGFINLAKFIKKRILYTFQP